MTRARILSWPIVAVAAGLATASAAVDRPEEVLRLAPSSNWVVDYDADSCALRRAFDSADDKVTLEFRQYAPGDMLQVIVASNYLETEGGRLRVKFEPDDRLLERPHAIVGTFGEGIEGLFYQDSLRANAEKDPDGEPAPWSADDRDAREEAISGLLVTDGFERDVMLQTGAMHRPMVAMRACIDELLTHWGIDVEAHRTLSRPVTPKLMHRWVRRVQEQYPVQMLHQRRGGYIHIRLMIAADGKPTSCNVQIEASHPAFQQAACDTLMRHAQFDPALDAAGQPIASYFITSILYQVAN
jgi:TonB family protein